MKYYKPSLPRSRGRRINPLQKPRDASPCLEIHPEKVTSLVSSNQGCRSQPRKEALQETYLDFWSLRAGLHLLPFRKNGKTKIPIMSIKTKSRERGIKKSQEIVGAGHPKIEAGVNREEKRLGLF